MAMIKIYEWNRTKDDRIDRIEEAICKLEKVICDELDIDLGHMVLKPLDYHHPKSLRDKIEQYLYDEQFKEV